MKAHALVVGVAVALAELASAQSFFGTCEPSWHVTLTSDHAWMYAECRSKSGATITSRLDLNYCVGNDNGELIADEDGRFKGSCQDCLPDSNTLVLPGDVELPPGITIPGLTGPSSELVCSCKRKNGSLLVGTTLDLNDIVGNSDGILSCYGHTGERA